MTGLRISSANVQCILESAAASRVLRDVLATDPDVVLLQEWALKRVLILRREGSVRVVAPVSLGCGGVGDYRWFAPITGGCAIGIRDARFEGSHARLRFLSLPGWSEGQRVQPGRTALEVRAIDQITQRPVTFISYHLIPGSEFGGNYLPDRPHQAARHRHEQARLQRAIDRSRAIGDVYAGGDSNFDGFAIKNLVSAWSGSLHEPGRIDDVFAPRAARAITTIETESDHRALVVDY